MSAFETSTLLCWRKQDSSTLLLWDKSCRDQSLHDAALPSRPFSPMCPYKAERGCPSEVLHQTRGATRVVSLGDTNHALLGPEDLSGQNKPEAKVNRMVASCFTLESSFCHLRSSGANQSVISVPRSNYCSRPSSVLNSSLGSSLHTVHHVPCFKYAQCAQHNTVHDVLHAPGVRGGPCGAFLPQVYIFFRH